MRAKRAWRLQRIADHLDAIGRAEGDIVDGDGGTRRANGGEGSQPSSVDRHRFCTRFPHAVDQHAQIGVHDLAFHGAPALCVVDGDHDPGPLHRNASAQRFHANQLLAQRGVGQRRLPQAPVFRGEDIGLGQQFHVLLPFVVDALHQLVARDGELIGSARGLHHGEGEQRPDHQQDGRQREPGSRVPTTGRQVFGFERPLLQVGQQAHAGVRTFLHLLSRKTPRNR